MDKYKNGVATIHQNIRKLLKRRKPMPAWVICNLYEQRYGKRYSDSAMTARLRQMRDIICNHSTYEYEIIKEKQYVGIVEKYRTTDNDQ